MLKTIIEQKSEWTHSNLTNAATQFFIMTQKNSGFSEADLEGKYFVRNVSALYEI
jgi:hypothetical protein